MKVIFFAFFVIILLMSSVSAQTNCVTFADEDCNQKVDFDEVMDYISVWYKCSDCASDIFNAFKSFFDISFCGNCEIDGSDTCDDCNNKVGDGCSSLCKLENGWECSGEPSICEQSGYSDDGLILHLKFDDDIDDEIMEDSSGNGYYANCTGNFCPTKSNGIDGLGAVSFDGIDDFLDLGIDDFGLEEHDELTISFWVNFNSIDTSGTILAILTKGMHSRPFAIRTSGDNLWSSLRLNTGSKSIYSTQNFEAGNWYHIVQAFRNGSIYLYINGEIDNSIESIGGLSVLYKTHTYIGKQAPQSSGTIPSNEWHLNGEIDELMIFKRYLSESEIEYLYDSKKMCQTDGFCNNTNNGEENCMNCPNDCPCTSPNKCVYGICELCVDEDGDGFNRNGWECGEKDCNDNKINIWKEHEVFIDNDGDGFGSWDEVTVCSDENIPLGYSGVSGDCNDDFVSGVNVYPGATETCDGIDNNCDLGEADAVDCEFNEICYNGDCVKDPCAEIPGCYYYDNTSKNECELGAVSCGHNCSWEVSTSSCKQQFSKTYYVNFDGGNDAHDGLSASSAWKHCPGDDNAINVPKNIDLQPGNRILFKGGVQYNGQINVKWSGTKANPIKYDGNSEESWGFGKAIIDGQAVELGPDARQYGFLGANIGNIFIDNFEIRELRNLYEDIYGNQAYGIKFYSYNDDSGIVVKDNFLYNIMKPPDPVLIGGAKEYIEGENGTSITLTTFTGNEQDYREFYTQPGTPTVFKIVLGWEIDNRATDYDRAYGYIGNISSDGKSMTVYKDFNLETPGWAHMNINKYDPFTVEEGSFFYWIYNVSKGTYNTNGASIIFVSGFQDVYIHDNTIKDGRMGIQTSPSSKDPDNIYIYNNDISHVSWGIQGSGGIVRKLTNINIFNNSIHDFFPMVKHIWGWHNDPIYIWGASHRHFVNMIGLNDPSNIPSRYQPVQKGDKYIVGDNPTGAWMDVKDNKVVNWTGTEWEIFDHVANPRIVKDEDQSYYYNDGVWEKSDGIGVSGLNIFNNHFYGDIRYGYSACVYLSFGMENINIFNNVFSVSAASLKIAKSPYSRYNGGPGRDIKYLGNTFARIPSSWSGSVAVHPDDRFAVDQRDMVMKNNIFYKYDGYSSCFSVHTRTDEDFVSDNNLFECVYTSFNTADLGYMGKPYGLEEYISLTGNDQNSVLHQDPLFKNFPQFYSQVIDIGSTKRIYYEPAPSYYPQHVFEVGDRIEYELDGEMRTITTVGPGYFEIDKELDYVSSPPDEVIHNWKNLEDFKVDVRIESGSPARNKGADLTEYCDELPALCFDKDGNPRDEDGDGNWDIGAFEYTS